MKLIYLCPHYFFLIIILAFPLHSQTLVWEKLLNISTRDIVRDKDGMIYLSGSQSGSYVWRSTDNGNSWLKLSAPNLWDMVIDTSGTIWGATPDGNIFKSVNQALDWIQCYSVGLNTHQLAVSSNNWIWGTANYGVIFFSSDNGVSWDTVLLPASHMYSICGDSQNNIYTGSNGKIFKSTDLGLSWVLVYNVNNSGWINGIVADNDGYIYANRSGIILRSNDGGTDWEELPSGQGLGGLYLDQNHIFYASPGHRSQDNCITWQYIGPPWNTTYNYLPVDSLLFAANSDGLYVNNPDSIPYFGYDYFPLAVGNKWQFHQQNGYYYHVLNTILTVDRDSIINDNKYFLLQGYINDWVRYDHESRQMFIRWNNTDYVNSDFSLNVGSQFQQMLFNTHEFKYPHVLENVNYSIFDSIYHTKHIQWISSDPPTVIWGNETYYSEGLGEVKEEYSSTGPGGSSFSSTTKLIRAILNDSTEIKYYSDKVKPLIWFTPFPMSDTLILNFNFEVDHNYTTYYFNGALKERFVDSVILYSYYKKEDSIITNEPALLDTVPGQRHYTIHYFLDSSLIRNGFDYYYKIYAVDKGIVPEHSTKPDSGYYRLNDPPSISNEQQKNIDYILEQNYPNPFNPSTSILYTIPEPGTVSMKLYDIIGREVAILVNEEKAAGEYRLTIDASSFPSGVYFYRLQAGEFVQTRKMILIK